MAGLYNLMILGVMLIGVVVGVGGVTDQQFQELSVLVLDQSSIIKQMNGEIMDLKTENKRQNSVINKLTESCGEKTKNREIPVSSNANIAQNTTIEERVALLEIQVVEIQGAIALLLENDDFLFDEQVIQDERLLNLEVASDETDDELDVIDESIENLQGITIALDLRVTALEENGGDGGNSSVSELEERVETLEGTVADHETRISESETEIEDLGSVADDHETRLVAAEENIQGLQMTDINLDARITALEENGGGGSSGNGTVAFHVALKDSTTISIGTAVVFNEVFVDVENGYNSTTGVFTVPPGGDGLYYFSTYLTLQSGKYGWFNMVWNEEIICSVIADHDESGVTYYPQGACSAVIDAAEGDEISVIYDAGSDTTPLEPSTERQVNGFNAFRI